MGTNIMTHRLMIGVVAAGTGTLWGTAFAQLAPLGTPQEAKAMLGKPSPP
jgi:hypothetical protein